ncbi:MAG: tRNA (adenosine(37)-N6)-dimethylallyltransferase MiaA, partial [Lentisphaerae bacterium]|nr:tRNA (adenosine(37)-N6)-dimethylallyltransferase MiaA [Lentisphaerota bacterium]
MQIPVRPDSVIGLHRPTAFILVGATATGKSAVAQILAERRGAAVVSADSMLVYRGMDIGTAKPSAGERGAVPYFGIDLADPSESYSAGAWVRAVTPAFRAPTAGVPIVVGGTGLYIRALLSGLDAPAADGAARARWQGVLKTEGIPALQRALLARDPHALDPLADPLNPRRLIRALERLDAGGGAVEKPAGQGPVPLVVGLRMPRPILHRRIRERAERMFDNGLAEEVRALRARFPIGSETARAAIGYAEAGAWLDGHLTRAEAVERTVIRTRQLAKRQETWFRHQAQVVWVDATGLESAAALADRVNEQWEE